MSEIKITKGHVLAGLGGLVTGIVATLGITKWLPEYQERVARRQGAIMAEEFAKRTGIEYKQGNPSEVYSIRDAIEAINARLDDLERRLRDYRGANM